MSFNLEDNNPGYPETMGNEVYQFRNHKVNTQCHEWDRNHILELFNRVKDGIFVEIGIFGGSTLLHLYDKAVESNSVLIGVDPHDKINLYNGKTVDEVSENVKVNTKNLFEVNRKNLQEIILEYKLEPTIKYINDFSANASTSFEDNSIDLLHIDGDHSTKGVYDDLKNYWPKMKKGGVVICDDYNWGSIERGVHKFTDEFSLKGETYNNRKYIITK
jgi:hypothetical protein